MPIHRLGAPTAIGAIAALLAAGCGEDAPAPAASADAGVPDAALLGCAPGEAALDDGTCRPPGVPADACAAGFAPDDAGGCTATLPAVACDKGTMAVPGEAACHEIMPCGDGPWGAIPIEANTRFVDASFTGVSDGSQAKPFTSIADAVAAADDGAVVAITDGTYDENVAVVFKPVRLWGRCPSKVAIVASAVTGSTGFAVAVGKGADGTEVHGLALTGVGAGLVVLGASDVVADRVWVHDTVWTGVELQPDPSSGITSALRLSSSLVEHSNGTGITVASSNAVVESSVVRDTKFNASNTGRGIDAFQLTHDDVPSSVELRGSLVERNHNVGVLAASSTVTIEGSLVRDTTAASSLPSVHGAKAQRSEDGTAPGVLTVRSSVFDKDDIAAVGAELHVEDTVVRGSRGEVVEGGAGIAIANVLGSGERATGTIARCLIDDTQVAGIMVKGSDASIEGTIVRNTLLAPTVNIAAGIFVYHDGTAGQRGKADVKASLVEHNPGLGILVLGSDVSLDHTESSHNQPRAGDGFWGRGLQVQVDDAFGPLVAATATVVDSAFRDNFEGGVLIAGGTALVQRVVVGQTKRGSIDQELGDGISVFSLAGSPASVEIDGAEIADNARAGIATFGADVTIANALLSCNAFHLDAEAFEGHEAKLTDGGGNVCSCDGQAVACKALSASLAPPGPLSAP